MAWPATKTKDFSNEKIQNAKVQAVGSVALTSLEKRFANIHINVKSDFDAIGDGVTDDTAAIQAAIDAGGDTVYFPAGNYLCSTAITLPSPVNLRGESQHASRIIFSLNGFILDASAVSARFNSMRVENLAILSDTLGLYTGFDYTGKVSSAGQAPYLTFENVLFCGSEVSGATSKEWKIGADLNEGTQARFINVTWQGKESSATDEFDTATIGLLITATTGVMMQGCQIFRMKYGIKLTGQSEGMFINNCTIVACYVGIWGTGLVDPSNEQVITNSHISASYIGIDIEALAGGPINQCVISGCFILMRPASEIITGQTEYYGIRIASDFGGIANNVIQVNSDPSITVWGIDLIDASNDNTISGNKFRLFTTAVRLGASTLNNLLANNIYSPILATHTYLTDSGTTNKVESDYYALGDKAQTIYSKSGAAIFEKTASSTETHLRADALLAIKAGGQIDFYAADIHRASITGSGNFVPVLDGVKNIGSSSTRWGSGYFATAIRLGTLGNTQILTGSGSPESSVTANPGSLYTDTAGGAGTTLYVKESGTGNTGWIAK